MHCAAFSHLASCKIQKLHHNYSNISVAINNLNQLFVATNDFPLSPLLYFLMAVCSSRYWYYNIYCTIHTFTCIFHYCAGSLKAKKYVYDGLRLQASSHGEVGGEGGGGGWGRGWG